MSIFTERREVIAEMIIKALVELKIPWCSDCGFPRNIISRKRYDGVNPLLLNLAAHRYGWTTPYWGSYSQWISQGCTLKSCPVHVKAGEWAQEIVLYKPPINGTIEQELERWAVFNLNQIENGFANLRSEQRVVNFCLAEKVIKSTNAKIKFKDGLEAAYYYRDDIIVFPLKEQFVNGPGGLPAYCNSLFHECLHWSESRLGWDAGYVGNELRAEIGADYLCSELGIPRLPMSMRNNHKSYLDKWVKMIRKDPDFIFRVTASAAKAADFILSFSQRIEPRHNPPAEVA